MPILYAYPFCISTLPIHFVRVPIDLDLEVTVRANNSTAYKYCARQSQSSTLKSPGPLPRRS